MTSSPTPTETAGASTSDDDAVILIAPSNTSEASPMTAAEDPGFTAAPAIGTLLMMALLLLRWD